MRYLYFFLFGILLCNCTNKREKNHSTLLPDSGGGIGEIMVVLPNPLKDTLQPFFETQLGYILDAVPQPEKSFYYNYLPLQSFKGYVQRNRCLLTLHSGPTSFKVATNVYAMPQTVISLTAPSTTQIKRLLLQQKDSIKALFELTEIKWKQKKIQAFKHSDKTLQAIGISMIVPNYYRYAKTDKDFFWLRRDTPKGSLNLLVFKLAYKGRLKAFPLAHIRDSIGKQYIPGPLPKTHFATEYLMPPITESLQLAGKKTLKTQGLWEVKHDFMGGPYINYLVRVSKDTVIALEGFVYDPLESKKPSLLELDAIMRSINFVN